MTDPSLQTQSPTEVVTAFLRAMATNDVEAAVSLVAEDIVYTNVSLATIRGRKGTARIIGLLERPLFGFGVSLLAVAADGNVVLTERVDELRTGPWSSRFWVCGRFEVHEGQITLWRDYFDFLDVLRANLRGLLAVVVPSAQRPLPESTVGSWPGV